MNLRARIFLVLLGIALVPTFIVAAWFLRSDERTRENTQAMHGQLALLARDTVESSVGEFNRSLAFVEDLERDSKSSDDFLLLQNAVNAHPAFGLVSLLDAGGRETLRLANSDVFRDEGPVQRSGEPVVAQALRTGKLSVGPVASLAGNPHVFLAYPLSRGRLLYAAYSFKTLWHRLSDLKVGRTGRMLLLGPDGKPLPGIAEDFPERDWKGPGTLSGDSGWLDDVPTRAGAMVGAYASTPSLGWIALSLEPRSEAFAVGDHFYVTFMLFLLAVALIVFQGAYWISGRMTRPLLALVEGARRVSRNEFNELVPEIGWGELSLLSKTFNLMMTELKEYQVLQIQRLMEEKARVDSLVHTMTDGIVMTTFDGEIAYMNRTARSLFGISELTDLKGKSVHEMLRQPALRRMALTLMKREKRLDRLELEMKDDAGKRLGIFSCLAVAVMQERREIGILISLRDVTAEREVDRMKEDFFHAIVHDLKTPLTTINGFVELMQEKSHLGEKEKTYINYVRKAADNLQQLVVQILDAAKLESGEARLKPEPISLKSLMDQLRTLYAIQAEHQRIRMEFLQETAPGATLLGDRSLIERVLTNLISNSLKFTPKGGQIRTVAKTIGGEAEFCVSDTGPGIPKDKLEVVFEKFKQLDKGIEVRSGYGLGLSICKKIVELHRGRIWAESEPGQGSRFIFRLPLSGITA